MTTSGPDQHLVLEYLAMKGHFNGLALIPRSAGILWVLIITRISTLNQDEKSLDDQAELCKNFVRQHYQGPIEFRIISDQNSGELLDREKLREAEDAVASGKYDLVVCEDVGRICRRNRAIDFVELCEDNSTRLISINDNIDSARPDWRMHAFFASLKHESHNTDTAARIRRTLRHRFMEGGINQTFPPGYIKPDGAKSDADIYKDPAFEPFMMGMIEMLEKGATYEEVADWFHTMNAPFGRWARSKKWTAKMVARLIYNPILKGYRRRNDRKSKRTNKSGRRKSIKAPKEELLLRPVPHLAYIDEDRYDRLILKLKLENAWCARRKEGESPDPRAGVSKKTTIWPSQHAVCGVCGYPLNLGSTKKKRKLSCSGVRERTCWCSVSACGNETGNRIAAALYTAIEALPYFDTELIAQIEAEAAASNVEREAKLKSLRQVESAAKRKASNIADALAENPRSAVLAGKLREAETDYETALIERNKIESIPCESVKIPAKEVLLEMAREATQSLAFDSPEFGRTMSTLVPLIETFPVRALIGGGIYLRARCKVRLMSLLGESKGLDAKSFEVTIWVDLFDPQECVRLMPDVVALTAGKMKQRDIAKKLGTHQATVQRAMKLHRLMHERGTTDPYEFVMEPPSEGKHYKRHLKPRYEFKPKPGYPAWPDA